MKVIINKCYGGFGFSTKAVLEAVRREAKCVTTMTLNEFTDGKGLSTNEYTGLIEIEDGFQVEVFKDSGNSWMEEILYKDNIVYFVSRGGEPNPRIDPIMIAIVEELGPEANGRFAELAIIEIPDDIEWHIEEYDGIEHIAEEHNTWS